MAEFHKQDCVLCGTPAEYCFADYGKRKYFSCENCTKYQITDSAEAKMETAPAEWRKQYSEQAKSLPDDMVLSISVPSDPKTEGLAYPSLSGEPTHKDDLPQCS
jgi:hypothetical protein